MKHSTRVLVLLLALMLVGTLSAAQLKLPHTEMLSPFDGKMVTVPVVVESLSTEIDGFSLCLAVMDNNYTVVDVTPGAFFASCGWEYFNWQRLTPEGLLPYPGFRAQPASVVRITAVASAGEGQPTCFGNTGSMELARVKLSLAYASPTRMVNYCSFAPLCFYWLDCTDNVLHSRGGEAVLTASSVKAYVESPYGFGILQPVTFPFPGYGIVGNQCQDGSEIPRVEAFEVIDGGFEFYCEDLLMVGDLNLDGVPFEAGDGQLYASYFLHGLSVFPLPLPEVIRQSDVNRDGVTLTVADMVQLLRNSIYDNLLSGKPTLQPGKCDITASAEVSGTEVNLSTDCSVGACYLRLVTPSGRVLKREDFVGLDDAAMVGAIGDTTTILWASFDGSAVLGKGNHTLFAALAAFRITEASLADTWARQLTARITQAVPRDFALGQNYPNPFNPTTEIAFDLPVVSAVRLEIFNVLGEQVAVLADAQLAAGHHTFSWAGTNAAHTPVGSGVYFYRLQAGSFSQTRKMLLMK